MILGNLNNLGDMKYIHPKLKEMLEYLRDNDLTERENGRIEVEGERLFINIEENEMAPKGERRPEAHRKYLDIQLVLSGEEAIGVAVDNSEKNLLGIEMEYSEEKDIMFYREVANETMAELYPGDFAVFFPEDIHRPRCLVEGGSGRSKKAIVKMRVDFLG